MGHINGASRLQEQPAISHRYGDIRDWFCGPLLDTPTYGGVAPNSGLSYSVDRTAQKGGWGDVRIRGVTDDVDGLPERTTMDEIGFNFVNTGLVLQLTVKSLQKAEVYRNRSQLRRKYGEVTPESRRLYRWLNNVRVQGFGCDVYGAYESGTTVEGTWLIS